MEEVKEAPVQPAVSTPQTVVSTGMAEFHGFNGTSKFGVGVPRNSQVPAVAATNPLTSTSSVVLKPPGSSPVKPVANSSVVTLPHTGPSHLKLDKDVNGPLNLSRGRGTALILFGYFAFLSKIRHFLLSFIVNKILTWLLMHVDGF